MAKVRYKEPKRKQREKDIKLEYALKREHRARIQRQPWPLRIFRKK